MKFEKEILEILSKFQEDWMDKSDREEFNSIMLGMHGENLSKAIQEGLDKGHPLEYQMEYIRLMFLESGNGFVN